jgi:hypothetical protein
VVEDTGAEDQPADQVGSLQRGQQRHGRPVAVAQQVGRAADDLLEEGDRVLRHELIGDGAFEVGGAPVPAPVGSENVKMLGELGHVLLEGPRVRQSGVQEHERLPHTILLVIGVHVAELYVVGHLISSSLSGTTSGCEALGISGRRTPALRVTAIHMNA